MTTLADIPTPEAMDFWKWFVSAYFAYGIYAKWVETQAHKKMLKSGSKEEPFNIAQPLSIQKAIRHAEKPELDKLKDAVTTLALSVNSNHDALKLLGAERENSIKETLRAEISAVMREVTGFKEIMNTALGNLRERIAAAESTLDNLRE